MGEVERSSLIRRDEGRRERGGFFGLSSSVFGAVGGPRVAAITDHGGHGIGGLPDARSITAAAASSPPLDL